MRKIIVEVPESGCKDCPFNELDDCMAFGDEKGHALPVLKSKKPHKVCREASA